MSGFVETQLKAHADLLEALATCRVDRQFAGLDASGHDLDHVTVAGGNMRRQTELTNEHYLIAPHVDRQHCGYLAAE